MAAARINAFLMEIRKRTEPAYAFGRLSAWATVVICIVYVATLLAGGVVRGLPREPYFALAEILTMISSVVLVMLMAAIHLRTPAPYKIFSLLGLGWMFALAGITMTVHFAKLTVGRQLDGEARAAFARLFDFEWPSLLYAVEFAAWHIGFGMSVLFAAFAFRGAGRERTVRIGLIATGILCLAGLAGPVAGDLNWRLVGVFGYAVVFPVVCMPMARIFRSSPEQ